MKGSILVIPAGAEAVAEELAASCEDVFGIPGDLSVVAKGETLYGKMDCGECHGESGRGGVENFNALPAEKVPSLDGYAESVMFWGPGEKDLGAAIQLLAEKVSLHSLASNPPFPNYDVFLRQYDAYRTIMLEGRFTPRKDPDGPEPPLQMPAWQARLTPDEIDALFAYLLSLSRGVRPEPITQPLSFNHALHVVDAGLVCLDCHQGVSASPLAGLPAKVVCQDCHFPEDAEGESVSRDLVTLIGYFGQEREIPWSRVYRLPDEVRFSHVRHLEGGSLRCEQCHGEVSQLTSPPEMPFYRMRMSWCLDCHRQRQATQDCRACHL